MTIEQAIKKAIEEGFEPYRSFFFEEEYGERGVCPKPYLIEVGMDGHEDFECPHSIVVFKWDEDGPSNELVNDENSTLGFTLSGIYLMPDFWQSLGKAQGWPANPMSWKGWKKQWHDFIDHLAEGRSADEFFVALDASTRAAPPTKSQVER